MVKLTKKLVNAVANQWYFDLLRVFPFDTLETPHKHSGDAPAL